MVNGEEYAWEDVQVAPNGVVLEGIDGIEYTTERDFNEIYGRGKDPHTLGRGKKKYTAKLTILQSEFEAWQRKLSKGEDLTDLAPFDIPVSYAPEEGVPTTDILKRCRVKSFKKGMKTGDGNQAVELDLALTKILYNA